MSESHQHTNARKEVNNGSTKGAPLGHHGPLRQALNSETEPPYDRDRDGPEAQVSTSQRGASQSPALATSQWDAKARVNSRPPDSSSVHLANFRRN